MLNPSIILAVIVFWMKKCSSLPKLQIVFTFYCYCFLTLSCLFSLDAFVSASPKAAHATIAIDSSPHPPQVQMVGSPVLQRVARYLIFFFFGRFKFDVIYIMIRCDTCVCID